MRILFWHQTQHERPMALSFRIGQWPSIVSQVPLLYDDVRALSIEGPPIRGKRPPDAGDPQGVRHMEALGFAYVVVHPKWISMQHSSDVNSWRMILEDALGPGRAYRDGSVVFSLSQGAREALIAGEDGLDPRMILGEGESWQILAPQRAIGADQLGKEPPPNWTPP